MLKIILVAGTMVVAGSAFAEEVIIHREDAPPPPTSSKTVVEHHDALGGCETKTVHKENGIGDSTTVKKSDC